MPSITLYGSRMGSSLRPHWMLCELGLPYDAKNVDLKAGEQRTPEFLAMNPAGQVPVIVIDGFVLAESMAITHYLAARYKPELNGRTIEEQAKAMQWELWVALRVQREFGVLSARRFRGVDDPIAEAKAKEELAKHLPILDEHLSKNAYIAGEYFTTGDMNACVGVQYATFSDYDLSGYPHICRWRDMLMSRPAYVTATTST